MVPHVDGPAPAPGISGAAAGRALVLVTLLSLAASDASAQHIRGQLRDVVTERPIAVGVMTLLDADSVIIRSVVTDAGGSWNLDVPGAGMYYVVAERLGYQSWVSGPFFIAAGDRLTAVFHLRAAPVVLEPLEVQAAAVRRYLEYNGFFERQRGNFGHFVTPDDIDRRQAARVTDLLTGIPGVQRVGPAGGSAGPSQIQLRGSSLSQGGSCRPRVFVDGLMYNVGDSRPVRLGEADATERSPDDQLRRLEQSMSLDDIGHPSTVAAIEVYRSASQVPVQFGGTSVETLCGVIVVWTRTGRMRIGER
ncbi:MAG TPA: TonB-dependent receptor plug domain-containing protein [Longimicrobiales bacterium]